jgi:hypothetical protein
MTGSFGTTQGLQACCQLCILYTSSRCRLLGCVQQRAKVQHAACDCLVSAPTASASMVVHCFRHSSPLLCCRDQCRVTVPARFNSSRNISFTAATVAPGLGSPGGAANVTSANLFSGRVSAADGTAVGADHLYCSCTVPPPRVTRHELVMCGTRSMTVMTNLKCQVPPHCRGPCCLRRSALVTLPVSCFARCNRECLQT